MIATLRQFYDCRLPQIPVAVADVARRGLAAQPRLSFVAEHELRPLPLTYLGVHASHPENS